MTRRALILVLTLTLVHAAAAAWGQQPEKVVGVLMATTGLHDPLLEAFRRGLQELGYVEGRNIRLEFRGAQGELDRLPRLADELVQLKADAIIVGTEPATRAARNATTSIPIVMVAYTYDPIASGFVESVARPGGNLTGIFTRAPELAGKRIELLKEAIPNLSRVAVLFDSPGRKQLLELEPAARSLDIKLELLELQAPYDFKAAFKVARRKKTGAVMVLTSTAFYSQRARIAAQSLASRLPVTSYAHELTRAGGLISYGPDLQDAYYRSAYFIDRLLKGAKPSELPVEQTTTFKLVVNLKTAKALGITIPESILLRADEVIR